MLSQICSTPSAQDDVLLSPHVSHISFLLPSKVSGSKLTTVRTLLSDLVTFKLGEEGQNITLRSWFVAKLASNFWDCESGGRHGNRDSPIVLKDTKLATFLCFIQFVFLGDYQTMEASSTSNAPLSDKLGSAMSMITVRGQ